MNATRARRPGFARALLSFALTACLFALLPGCTRESTPQGETTPATAATLQAPRAHVPSPLVHAARRQVGVTVRYDPAYVRLAYPGGDVPPDRGVCTDVVVRALRAQGIDLQAEIHRDRAAHRAAYPQPHAPLDRNIDHRRVPQQMAWFARQGWRVPIGSEARDYRAGDIVAWRLRGNGLLHIGIVSDRRDAHGVPLILHNIGAGTREEPLLFDHPIIGHYRPRLGARQPARR